MRSSLPGNNYGNLSGTSMATPHLSGTVALIWSAAPNLRGDLTRTRDLLAQTAIHFADLTCGGTQDNNNVWGNGRLNARAAVALGRVPSGRLTGTVSTQTGPVARATVTVALDTGPMSTTTGDDGRYSLTLPVGAHEVTISATGYRRVTQHAEVLQDQTTTLDVVLARLAALSGTITNANDGQPVAGATVTATRDADIQTATSAADGTYRIYLDLGSWDLTFAAERYAAETRQVQVEHDGQELATDAQLRTAVASVDPTSIQVSAPTDAQHTVTVRVSNSGSADLTWQALLRGGGPVIDVAVDSGTTGAGTDATTDAGSVLADATGRSAGGRFVWTDPPSRTVDVNPAHINAGTATTAGPGGTVQAHPSAGQWIPNQPAPNQPRILTYADDPVHPSRDTYLDQALRRLGLGYTAFYENNFAGFELALREGNWDIVLLANDRFAVFPTTLDAINDYVIGGGKFAGYTWRVGQTYTHPLWANLGIQWRGDVTTPPLPVHWWEPNHPVFTQPELAPEYRQLVERLAINGQRGQPLAGFQKLAGWTENPADDQAAMVIGNNNRTVLRTFLDGQNDADLNGDGNPDPVELWTNLVDGLQHDFQVDVPWLQTDPASGTVPIGSSRDLTATIDTSGMAPGRYKATILLATDAGRQPQLAVRILLEVTEVTFDQLRAQINAYNDSGQVTDQGASLLLATLDKAERAADQGRTSKAIELLEQFKQTAGDPGYVPDLNARDVLISTADRLIAQLQLS